jgi:hypothetical protein
MRRSHPYQLQWSEHWLLYELLKRKLRTSIVKKVISCLGDKDLQYIYYKLHRERPLPGKIPSLDSITRSREAFLYVAVFASIYRCASQRNVKTGIDINAVMFAWDCFCKTFPGHISERRPFSKIRPANFTEAWVIAEAIQTGMAELRYCSRCHHDFVIFYDSNYQPICQVCAMKIVSST